MSYNSDLLECIRKFVTCAAQLHQLNSVSPEVPVPLSPVPAVCPAHCAVSVMSCVTLSPSRSSVPSALYQPRKVSVSHDALKYGVKALPLS